MAEDQAQSEERFRALVENASDLVALINADGVCEFQGPSSEAILGYRPEEMVGRNVFDFVHPDDVAASRERFKELLVGRRDPSLATELRFRHKDGSWRVIEVKCRPFANARGEVSYVFNSRDITDRKQAEEGLKRSEKHYRLLAENTADFVWLVDPETMGFLYASPACKPLLGYTPEELLGRSFADFIDPAAVGALSQEYRSRKERFRADPETFHGFSGEIEAVRKDGSRVWTDVVTRYLADEETGRVEILGVSRDITERRQAQAALMEREERYQLMFESAPLAINVTRGTDILYANPPYLHMFGYSSLDEIASLPPLELFTPEWRPAILENLRRRAQGLPVPNSYEAECVRKDGTRFPVLMNFARTMFADGAATIGFIADITDLKRAEEALRTSQTQLEAAMDLADLVSWEFDVDSGLFTFNDRFYALYGTTADAEGGYQMPADVYAAAFVHPDDQHLVAEEIEGAIRSVDPNYHAYIEHRIVRRDGEIRHIVVRYGITKDEHGRTVKTHGANQDITERKRSEEALVWAEEQLLQAQKMEAIGQLAGGIAHDFNNLLTIIGGSASLLLADMSPGDTRRKLVADIKETGDRAANLTRQILAFSRRQTLRPQVLCMNDVVRGIESLLRRTLGEDIDLEVRPAEDLALTQVDPVQMEQVLLNLVVNARDAMPDGGRLVIETANVSLDAGYVVAHPWADPGSYVMLSVSDTGRGMDAATMARVFEPFFTTKAAGKGTGLGLSTVYGIVKQSGGSISVSSEPGHGSTFEIYLPVTKEVLEAPAPPLAETTQAPGAFETVMVVEDEVAVRELIVQVLSRAGYRVLPAGSLREVESLLKSETGSPDLLITDMVLPEGGDGQAVAELLRQRYPGLPIIFMSGYSQKAAAHAGGSDELAEFLEKPFELAVLQRRVRKMLDMRGRA
jgi:two-component system cell cycle sensor histidine kinase/response regulator CckA